MPQPAVVLFQSPNLIGLGHMSRLIAIALALRQLDPSIRVPFVVQGASHSLLESHGLPYLTIPSPRSLESTAWAQWPEPERSSLIIDCSKTLLRGFNADLVVFDCFPSVPFATAALEANLPMALCVRRMANFERHLQAHLWILSHVRLILVADEPGSVDLPAPLNARAVVVGPIVRPPAPGAAPASQDSPSAALASSKRIIVTGGGGGYPGTLDFYNLALRAFSRLTSQASAVEGVLITGPLFTDWLRLDLVSAMRVVPFAPDITSYFSSADVIICQAGYNTLHELVDLGVQTICVPAPRNHDDQFERASHMAERHRHIHLFRGSTPAELADVMLTCMNMPPETPGSRNTQGAHIAAERLYALLTDVRRARRAG
jgi:UDP-N-acetylglucosamine--N-acetylmuramyl-(pentapeptide) pyrophosphoryl-undecaprenol N-acetylglucosamine transferase